MGISDVRSRAGKKGMARRYGHNLESILDPDGEMPERIPKPPPGTGPSRASAGNIDALLTDPDPTVQARLHEFAALVGMPTDWSEVKVLEQVRAEIIKTSHNELDLRLARGRLVDRRELEEQAKRIRDVWWREAQQITTLALGTLTHLPLEVRGQVKAAIESAINTSAANVKGELGA